MWEGWENGRRGGGELKIFKENGKTANWLKIITKSQAYLPLGKCME